MQLYQKFALPNQLKMLLQTWFVWIVHVFVFVSVIWIPVTIIMNHNYPVRFLFDYQRQKKRPKNPWLGYRLFVLDRVTISCKIQRNYLLRMFFVRERFSGGFLPHFLQFWICFYNFEHFFIILNNFLLFWTLFYNFEYFLQFWTLFTILNTFLQFWTIFYYF